MVICLLTRWIISWDRKLFWRFEMPIGGPRFAGDMVGLYRVAPKIYPFIFPRPSWTTELN